MIKTILSLLLAQACLVAGAQNAPAANLEPRKAGAAAYICGGVGNAEQEAIKSQAAEHDLMLTFAVSGGAYLADADVEIRDGRGAVVLAARCGGA